MHNSQPKLDQIMDNIGQKLNLLKHPIRGFNPAIQVVGPGDIEGHLGTDGQYYILDFGRYYLIITFYFFYSLFFPFSFHLFNDGDMILRNIRVFPPEYPLKIQDPMDPTVYRKTYDEPYGAVFYNLLRMFIQMNNLLFDFPSKPEFFSESNYLFFNLFFLIFMIL